MSVLLVDFGEVLSEAQPPEILEAMAQLTELPVPTFVERYWELRPPYDRGASAREFWSSMIGREMPEGELLEELIRLDVASWLEINPETLAVLEDVRGRDVPLSLLSNAPRELAEALRGDPLFELFDHLMFSSDLGIVKPEPGIFEVAAETLGVAPAEILFVDDRLGNVEAAIDAGMQAVQFTSAATLRSELEGRLMSTRAP